MLFSNLCALAIAASATLVKAEISPLFLLASTAELPLSEHDVPTNPPVKDVRDLLWHSLSSCPTKHYAVIVEPLLLSYGSSWTCPVSSFIPRTPNVRSRFTAEYIDGQVNVNHVLNTILMDCLHYGILVVEELDTNPHAIARGLPGLSQETLDKSIIYARMPEPDFGLVEKDYATIMEQRQTFVDSIVNDYFDDDSYTLIYLREDARQVRNPVAGHDNGAEVPLVGDH